MEYGCIVEGEEEITNLQDVYFVANLDNSLADEDDDSRDSDEEMVADHENDMDDNNEPSFCILDFPCCTFTGLYVLQNQHLQICNLSH